MSFAHDAKSEVLKTVCENECCKLAELSAIIHSCGELTKRGSEFFIELKTDMEGIYDIVNDGLNRLYGQSAEITLDDDTNINKSVRYIIKLPQECTEQLMFDCGIAKRNIENHLELIQGIDEHIVESDCCAMAYIKGVFITSSTASIVLDENAKAKPLSGYHWEFVFSTEQFADDFSSLLFRYGITNRKNRRKNLVILYIKEAEVVSDLLACVGAFKSVLKLQSEMTLRQVRNNINRQNNCISANISKTVNASVRQMAAIKKIQETIGIKSLPQNLQELCLVRLANPEEPLINLTKLVTFPITKSGINHQFRKIVSIANDIDQKDNQWKNLYTYMSIPNIVY